MVGMLKGTEAVGLLDLSCFLFLPVWSGLHKSGVLFLGLQVDFGKGISQIEASLLWMVAKSS